ncbi:trypsin inhibitor like cysteine rich domain-containing protein [Ditylenchus destructor]|uniref:Trypsin inhibitor like cysteine rich domain-containing protein n=1 Tax=Ditylenchus destructor TaxID=166010 RepID=A0AAD4MXP6_9BILA|nr:trypsin inhibitor like cysteine rich domain-containing protein [Ditylenchus destructor]
MLFIIIVLLTLAGSFAQETTTEASTTEAPFEPTTECDANEEFKKCGSQIEPTCEDPRSEAENTEDCEFKQNVCQCTKDTVRNEDTGECVPVDRCNERSSLVSQLIFRPINPCQYISCPRGKYCRLVSFPCRCPPCPRRPICVSVCYLVRCPRYHRCVPIRFCPWPWCPYIPRCIRFPIG